MPRRLENLHNLLLPPFSKGRKAGKVYKLRFQNARDRAVPYERMVLSSEFKEYVGPKSQSSVKWVDPGDDRLTNNKRNDLFATLIKVYHTKELAVCFAAALLLVPYLSSPPLCHVLLPLPPNVPAVLTALATPPCSPWKSSSNLQTRRT